MSEHEYKFCNGNKLKKCIVSTIVAKVNDNFLDTYGSKIKKAARV